jgi:hypothetical protein
MVKHGMETAARVGDKKAGSEQETKNAAIYASIDAASRQAQSPRNIPDRKLNAAALEQVASVKNNYQQRIEPAAHLNRERIADEANNALLEAVTDQGLSVGSTPLSGGGTERC